ncbi:MAG TPA: sensor histidine kinase [Streptosporangiaceae bacterium]|nr:sensor histidine kinase [Streptosporangiaceae bacterium]
MSEPDLPANRPADTVIRPRADLGMHSRLGTDTTGDTTGGAVARAGTGAASAQAAPPPAGGTGRRAAGGTGPPTADDGRAAAAWRWIIDASITIAVIFVQVGGSIGAGTGSGSWHHLHPAPGVLALVILGVGGASLIARRRYPIPVLAIALASALWAGRLNASVIWIALIVAFFTAILARERAAAIASLVIGYVTSVWPPWLVGTHDHASVMFALVLAAGLIFLLIVSELIRIRSQRGAALARSREEELRRLASEERMRMARDLHDVVAHNISVINVQANTALHLMDRQPERARTALTTINDVSKQALVELRSVLGVLRDVDAQAPRAPAPGLARLGDLVENASAAGLAVRVAEEGERVPLPADIDLAAYRIIQEALTNTARHSGGANATVRLGYGDGALRIEITDDGRPRPGRAPHANGSGNGIAGMAERAAALGGTLQAGPGPGAGSGVGVQARLPLPPAAPAGAAPTRAAPDEPSAKLADEPRDERPDAPQAER